MLEITFVWVWNVFFFCLFYCCCCFLSLSFFLLMSCLMLNCILFHSSQLRFIHFSTELNMFSILITLNIHIEENIYLLSLNSFMAHSTYSTALMYGICRFFLSAMKKDSFSFLYSILCCYCCHSHIHITIEDKKKLYIRRHTIK